MPHRLQLAIALVVGVAGGFVVAAFADRPTPSAAPVVDAREGAIVGKMGHTLRPVSVRIGDDARSVGSPLSSPPVERRSSVATVNLEVNGVPVRLEFEVEP